MSLGKDENDQRGTEFGLEGLEQVLQRFECVLNLRWISTTVSRMFWYKTLALNWTCSLIHFSYHLFIKKLTFC